MLFPRKKILRDIFIQSFFSRISHVESADEFYSTMAVLTREMLQFGLMDTNQLIEVPSSRPPSSIKNRDAKNKFNLFNGTILRSHQKMKFHYFEKSLLEKMNIL